MKIRELLEAEFETKQTEKKFSSKFNNERDLERAWSSKNPKSGRYALAHSVGDPHTIVKRSHVGANAEREGYYAYATEIIKSGIAKNNPYFPRFYDVKTFKDSSGLIKYRFEMERLQEGYEVNDEIINSVTENIFTEKSIAFFDRNYMGANSLSRLSQLCSMYIFSSSHYGLEVKDEKFREAAAFIKKIYDRGFSEDLHEGNIMFRLSPYPQLVITDPIQ